MFRLQFKILRKTHLLTPDVFQRYKNTPSCSLKRHLYNHLKVPMSRKLSRLLNIFNKHNQKWSTFNYNNNTDLKQFTNVNFSKSIVNKISKFKNCKSKKSVALLKKITKAISSKKCIIKKCGVRSSKNSKECSCNNKLPKDSLLIKIELPKEEYSIAKPFSNPASLTKIRSYNTLCAKYSKLQHILSKISRNNYKLRHCSNYFKDDDKLFRTNKRIKKSSLNKLKTNKRGTDTKTTNVISEGDCLMNNLNNTSKSNLHEMPNHHSLRVAKMKKNNIPNNPDKRNRKKIINIIIEISGIDNDCSQQFLNSTKRTINIFNDVDPEEVMTENIYGKLDDSNDIKFAPKQRETILPFASKKKMERTNSFSDTTKITIGENKNIISSCVESESRNQKHPANKEFTATKKNEDILPLAYKTKNVYDSKYRSKEKYFSVDCKSKKKNNLTLESDVKLNQSNLDAESKMNAKYYKDFAALDARAECKNRITENLLESYNQNKLDSSKVQTAHNKHRKLAPAKLKIDPENKKIKYVSNTNGDVIKIMHSKNLDIKSKLNKPKEVLNFSSNNNKEINTVDLIKKTQENKAKLNLKNKTADHKKCLKFFQQKSKHSKIIKHDINDNSPTRDSEIHWNSFKSEFNSTDLAKPSCALSESYNEKIITKCQLKSAKTLEKDSCKCNLIGSSGLNKDKHKNITENDMQTETEHTNYNTCQCSLHETGKNIDSIIDRSVTCENTPLSDSELRPENRNTLEFSQKNNKDNLRYELNAKYINKNQCYFNGDNANKNENLKYSIKDKANCVSHMCKASSPCDFKKESENPKNNLIKCEPIKNETVNSPVSVIKTNFKSNITEFKANSVPNNLIVNSKIESKNQLTSGESVLKSMPKTSSIKVSSCFKTEMNNQNSNNWSKSQSKLDETLNTNNSQVKMQKNIVANEAMSMSYNTNETENKNISKQKTIQYKNIEKNIPSNDLNSATKYLRKKVLETATKMSNVSSLANKNIIQQNLAYNMSGFTTDSEIKKTNTNNSSYSAAETKNQMFNSTECINPSCCSNGIQNKENTNRNESEKPETKNQSENIAKSEQIQIQNNCSTNSSNLVNIDNIQKNITNTKLESNNICNSYSKMQPENQNMNSETKKLNQNINEQQAKSDKTENTTPFALEKQVDQIQNITNTNEQSESNNYNVSKDIIKENKNSYKLHETEVNKTKNITSSDIQSKKDLDPVPNIPLKSENVQHQFTNVSNVIEGKPEDVQNNKTCLTDIEFEFDTNDTSGFKNKMLKKYIKEILLKQVKPDHRVFKVRPYVKQQYCYEEITHQYLQKISLDQQITNTQINHSENGISLDCTKSKTIDKSGSIENKSSNSNVASNSKKTTRDFEEKTYKKLNNEVQLENKLKTEKTDDKSAITLNTNNQEMALNANSKQLPKKLEKEAESQLITKSKNPETKLKDVVNKCGLKNESYQSHPKSSSEPTKNKDLCMNKNGTCSSELNHNVIASPIQEEKIVQENYETKIATSIKNNNEKQSADTKAEDQSELKCKKTAATNTIAEDQSGLKCKKTTATNTIAEDQSGLKCKKTTATNTITEDQSGLKCKKTTATNTITEDQSGLKCKKTAATNKLSARAASAVNSEVENTHKMKQYTNNQPLDNKTESGNANMKITELQSLSKSTEEIMPVKQDKFNLELAATPICSSDGSPTNNAINETTKLIKNKNVTEVEASQQKTNIPTIESYNQMKENKQALLSALVKFNNLLSKEVTKAIEIDSGSINITAELYSQLKKLKSILKIETDSGKRNYGIRHHDANQIEYETIKAGLINALVKFNNNKSNIVLKQGMNKKTIAKSISNIDTNFVKKQPDKALRMSKTNQLSIKRSNNSSRMKKTKKHFKRIKYIVTRKFNKIIGCKYNPKMKRHKFESDKDDDDNDNKLQKSKIQSQASTTNSLRIKKGYFVMKSLQFNQKNKFARNDGIDKQNYNNKNKLHTASAIYSNFSSKGPNNNDENNKANDIKNQKSHKRPKIFKIKSGRPEDYTNRLALVDKAPDVYKVPDKQNIYKKQNEESNKNKFISFKTGNKKENEKFCSRRYNFYTTLKPNEKLKNRDNSLSKAKLQAKLSGTRFQNNVSSKFEKNALGKKDSMRSKRSKTYNKYQYNSLRQQSTPQIPGFQVKNKTTFGKKKLLKSSLSKKSIMAASNQSFNNSGGNKSNDDNNVKKSTDNDNKKLNKTKIISNITTEDDNKALNKVQMVSNITEEDDNKALNKVEKVPNITKEADNKTLNKVQMVPNITKEDDNKALNKDVVSNIISDKNKAVKVKEESGNNFATETKIKSNQLFDNVKSNSTTKDISFNNPSDKITENQIIDKLSDVKSGQNNSSNPSPVPIIKVDDQVNDFNKIDPKYKYIVHNEPYHIKEVEVTNEMDKVNVLEENDDKTSLQEPIMLIDGHTDNLGTTNINRPNNNNNNPGKINMEEKQSVPAGEAKPTLETRIKPELKIKVRKTDHDSKNKSILENNTKLGHQFGTVSTEPVINKTNHTIEIKIKTDAPNEVGTTSKSIELQEAGKEKNISSTEAAYNNSDPNNNNFDPNKPNKDKNKNKKEFMKSRQDIFPPRAKLNNADFFETTKIENKNKVEASKSEAEMMNNNVASKPKDLFNNELFSSTDIQGKNKMETIKPVDDKSPEHQNMNKVDAVKTEQDTTDKPPETNMNFFKVATKYKYPFTNVPFRNRVNQNQNNTNLAKSVEGNQNLSSPETDWKNGYNNKNTNRVSTADKYSYPPEPYQTTENDNKNKLETAQPKQENNQSYSLENKILLDDNHVSDESTFKMEVKKPEHDNKDISILENKNLDNQFKNASTESANNYEYSSTTHKSDDHRNKKETKKTKQVKKSKPLPETGNLLNDIDRRNVIQDQIKLETKISALDNKDKLSSETRLNNFNQTENQLKDTGRQNAMQDQIKLNTKESVHDSKDKLSSEMKINIDVQTSQNNNLIPGESNKPLEIKLNTVEPVKKVDIISKKGEPQGSKEKSIASAKTIHKVEKFQNDSTEQNYLHPTNSQKSSKDQDKKILDVIKSGQNILSFEEKTNKDTHLNNIKTKTKTQENISNDISNDMTKQRDVYDDDLYKTTDTQDKNKIEAEKSVKDNQYSSPETKIKIEYQLSNMKGDEYFNETYRTEENQNMNKYDAVKSEQDTINKPASPETNINPNNQTNLGNVSTKDPDPKAPLKNKNIETAKPEESNNNLPIPETELKTFREIKNTAYNYSYPIGMYANVNNYNKNKMDNSNMYSPESNMKTDYNQVHNYPGVQNYAYPNQFHHTNQTMGHQIQDKIDTNKSGQERETPYDAKYPTTNQNKIEASYSFVNTPIKQNYTNTVATNYEQPSKTHSHYKTIELGSIVNDIEHKNPAYDPVDKFDLPTYLVSRTQNQKDTYNAIKNENKSNTCIFKYFNESENDSHLDEYDRPNYYSFTPNEDYPDSDFSIITTQKNVTKSTPSQDKNTLQTKGTAYDDVDTYDLPTYDYANDYNPATDSQKTYPKSVIVFQQNSNVPFRAENNQNIENQMKPKPEQVMYDNSYVNNPNTYEMKQNMNQEEVVTNKPNIKDIVSFAKKSKVDDNLDEFDRPTYNINNELFRTKPDIIKVEKYQLLKDEKGNYNLEMKYQYVNVVDNSVVSVHDHRPPSNAAENQNTYAQQMEDSSMLEPNNKKQDENMEYENNSNGFSIAPTSSPSSPPSFPTPPINPYPENMNEQERIYKYNNAYPIIQPQRKKIKLGKYQETLNTEDQNYLENLNNCRNDTANTIINSHKNSTNNPSNNKKHFSGTMNNGSENTYPDKKMLNPDSGFENNSSNTRMFSQSSFYDQNLEMVNKGGNKRDNFDSVIAANLVNSNFKQNDENMLQNWAMDDKIKEIDKKISAPDKFISKPFANNTTDDLLNSAKFPLSGEINLQPKIETNKKDMFKSLTDEELRLKLEEIKAKSEMVLKNLEMERKLRKIILAVPGAESVYNLPLKDKTSVVEDKPKRKIMDDMKFMTVFRSANTDFVNYSNNVLKSREYQNSNLGNQTNHIIPVCHSGPEPYRNKYYLNSDLWPNNENAYTDLKKKIPLETEAYNYSAKDRQKISEPTESKSNNIKNKSNNTENKFQSGLTASADNLNLNTAFHSGPSVYMNMMPMNLNIEDCAFTLNQYCDVGNRIDEVKLMEIDDIEEEQKRLKEKPINSENEIDEVEFTDSGEIIVNKNNDDNTWFRANNTETYMNSVYLAPLIGPLEIPQLESQTQREIYEKENVLNNNTDIGGSKMKNTDYICNRAATQSFDHPKPRKMKKTQIKTSVVASKKVPKTFKQNNDLMRTLMARALIRQASVPTVSMSNQGICRNIEIPELSTSPEWLEHGNDIFPSYIQKENAYAANQSSETNNIYSSNESACHYADILQMFHPKCTKTVVRRRKPRYESTNPRYGSREFSYFLTGHLNAPLDCYSYNKVPNNSKYYFSSISNKQLETTAIKHKNTSAPKISHLNNDVITSIQESNSINKLLSDQKFFASSNPKLIDKIISSYAEICSEKEDSASRAKEQNDESNNILGKLIISVMPKEKTNTPHSEHLYLSKSDTANIICPPEAKKVNILSVEKQSKDVLKDAILASKEMNSFFDHMSSINETICAKNMLNPCNKYIADLSNQSTKDENKSKGDIPKPNTVATPVDKQGSSEKISLGEIYPNKNQCILNNILTKTESNKQISSMDNALSHSNEHLEKNVACSSAKIKEHKSETYKDKTMDKLLASSSKILEESIAKLTKEKNKQLKSESIMNTLLSNNNHLEGSIPCFFAKPNKDKIEIKKNLLTPSIEHLDGIIAYPADKTKKGTLIKGETLSLKGEHLEEIIAHSVAKTPDKSFKGETLNNTFSTSNRHFEESIAYLIAKPNEEKQEIKNKTPTCSNEIQGSIGFPVVKIKKKKSKTINKTLSPSKKHLEESITYSTAKTNEEKNEIEKNPLICSNQLKGNPTVKMNKDKSIPLKSETKNITPKINKEKNEIKDNKLTHINEHLEGSIAHPLKTTEEKCELFKSETKNNTLSRSSEYLAKGSALSSKSEHLKKNFECFSAKSNDKICKSFDDKTLGMKSLQNALTHSNESITGVSAKKKEDKNDSSKIKACKEGIDATSLISPKLSKELLEDTTLSLNQYSQHEKSIVSFLHCLDNYRGLNTVNNILAQNSKHVARIICSPRKTMQQQIDNSAENNTAKMLSNVKKFSTKQSELRKPKPNELIAPSQNDSKKLIQAPLNANQTKVPQLAIKIIVPSEKINSIIVNCSMDSLIKENSNIKKVISKTNTVNPVVSTKSKEKSNAIVTAEKEMHNSPVLLENQDKLVKSPLIGNNKQNVNLDSILLTSAKSQNSINKSVSKHIVVENIFKGTPMIKDSSNFHFPSKKSKEKNSTPVKENKFGTLDKSLEADKNIANLNVNIKQDAHMKNTTIPQNANENDSLQKNKDNHNKFIPKSVDRAEGKLDTVKKVNFSNTNIIKEVGMEGISIAQQTNVKELKSPSKKNDAKMVLKKENSNTPETKKKEAEMLLEKARREQEIVNVQSFVMENKKPKESLDKQIDINYLTIVDDGKKYTTLDTFKKINNENSLFTAGDSQNVKFTPAPQNKNTSIREQVIKKISFEKIKMNATEKEQENKVYTNETEKEADTLITLFDQAIQAIESISVNNILNVRFNKVTTLSQKSSFCEKNEGNDSFKHSPETKKSIEIIMKPIDNAKNNPGSIRKDANKQSKETNSKNYSTVSKNIQPPNKKFQEVKRLSTTKPKSADKSASRAISKNISLPSKIAAKSLESINLKAAPKKESDSTSGSKKRDKSQDKKIDSPELKKTPLKKNEDNAASKDDKSTVKHIQIQDTLIHREAMEQFEKQIVETIIKNIPTKKIKPSKSDSKPAQKKDFDEKLKLLNVKPSPVIDILLKEENVKKVLKLKKDFDVLEKLLKNNSEIVSNNNQDNSLSKAPKKNVMLVNKENISKEIAPKDNTSSSMNKTVSSMSPESKCVTGNIISQKTKNKSVPKNEVISSSNHKKSKQESSTILNKTIEKPAKNAKNFKFTSSKCFTPEMIGSVKKMNPSSNNKIEADVIRNSIVNAMSRRDVKSHKNMDNENSANDTCFPEKNTNLNIVEQFKSYGQNPDSVVTDSDLMVTAVVSEKPICNFPKTEENYEEDEKVCKSGNVQYDSLCEVQEGKCVIKLTKEDQEFIEFRRNSSQYNGFINLAPSECVKDENGTYVYISTFDHETE